MTQCERVLAMAQKYGTVSRNWSLDTFPRITRLGARIYDLSKQGHKFDMIKTKVDTVYTYMGKA